MLLPHGEAGNGFFQNLTRTKITKVKLLYAEVQQIL